MAGFTIIRMLGVKTILIFDRKILSYGLTLELVLRLPQMTSSTIVVCKVRATVYHIHC